MDGLQKLKELKDEAIAAKVAQSKLMLEILTTQIAEVLARVGSIETESKAATVDLRQQENRLQDLQSQLCATQNQFAEFARGFADAPFEGKDSSDAAENIASTRPPSARRGHSGRRRQR